VAIGSSSLERATLPPQKDQMENERSTSLTRMTFCSSITRSCAAHQERRWYLLLLSSSTLTFQRKLSPLLPRQAPLIAWPRVKCNMVVDCLDGPRESFQVSSVWCGARKYCRMALRVTIAMCRAQVPQTKAALRRSPHVIVGREGLVDGEYALCCAKESRYE